ncbi:hypothetical protein CPAST_c10200 [Clostridium pasteurianum DSM 525 = ATCC 6013]|uniref:Zinc-ribbon domain-containing protein n=1 Tax=Clostridium pasteurianum DSM 525 = ATCC 6013 TaxID=1262449 RepID=A0A0H3J7Z6_CLOPA|nr:zinc ribbon domain-containing protein [Clostridium pasteurianum]AJA47120.1 hypothetical protein CPAST_c10200 [Clostridium pasteurianum DSM 525 = ATCC 6013]AJA51108.1 hypothetical protein CLPA_c10200 [Clostridium pasteurianum DSM 525 = ATCC 6013]AOZ74482.1 metal-binding protein [Clostridium pasteurianum DSM 525 = ATCC 6013]AOZ78279.1 metal-binding protein [Clostridium pasteurianum]ELP59491.1 metal-binding membrane protein [Clostridium pasteurianum DSM 525 = ATCC 6013]
MAYCCKCGTKLNNEDLFCPNCGEKNPVLSQKEEKNHKNYTELNNSNSTITSNVSNSVNFKDAFNVIINMFLRPASTAEKFINNADRSIAIIITIFVLIVQGFLGMWKVSQIISNINKLTINITNRIMEFISLLQPGTSSNALSSNDLEYFTREIERIRPYVKIPYGKVFIQNCTLIILAVLIVFIILCLANSMFSRGKVEVFKFYKTALIITLPALYFEFFSIMLSYLSINLGLAIALLGLIISLACFSIIIGTALSFTKNFSVFTASAAAIFTAIALSACLKSFIASDVTDIAASIMNAIKNFNL